MHSRGLAIRQKIVDLDPVTLSESFHNIGGDNWMLARYTDAERHSSRRWQSGKRTRRQSSQSCQHVEQSWVGLSSYRPLCRIRKSSQSFSGDPRAGIWPAECGCGEFAQYLGNGYWIQGRYAEAEAAHKRALDIREKAFGPDHSSVAESLLNLGNVYFSRPARGG